MENVEKGRQQAVASLKFANEVTRNASLAMATIGNFRRQQADLRNTMARAVSGAEKTQEEAKKAADLALGEVTEVQSTRLMEDDNLDNILNRARDLNNEVSSTRTRGFRTEIVAAESRVTAILHNEGNVEVR